MVTAPPQEEAKEEVKEEKPGEGVTGKQGSDAGSGTAAAKTAVFPWPLTGGVRFTKPQEKTEGTGQLRGRMREGGGEPVTRQQLRDRSIGRQDGTGVVEITRQFRTFDAYGEFLRWLQGHYDVKGNKMDLVATDEVRGTFWVEMSYGEMQEYVAQNVGRGWTESPGKSGGGDTGKKEGAGGGGAALGGRPQ